MNITHLEKNEIFVFGSNLAGRHGKGAALTAKNLFGAKCGIGIGPTGRCYAIPTKDTNLKILKLDEIQKHVNIFIKYVKENQDKIFIVTAIGCGLAGYKSYQIAPFFKEIAYMDNVRLPECFIGVLK